MKNILLAATAAILCLHATAQNNTWIIDAEGYYDHEDDKAASINNWQLSIAAGRQVADHWSAGIFYSRAEQQYIKPDSILYNTSSGPKNFATNFRYHQPIYRMGVWGRYIYNINKHFFFYTQVNIGLLNTGNEDRLPGDLGYYTPLNANGMKTQTSSIRDAYFVRLTPTIAMTIFKGFGVHASAGGIFYEHSSFAGSDNYDHISVDLTKQLSIGIQKIISTKKSRLLVGK